MKSYIYDNDPVKEKKPIKLKFENATLILALIGLGIIIINIISNSNSMEVPQEAVIEPVQSAPSTNELGIPQ